MKVTKMRNGQKQTILTAYSVKMVFFPAFGKASAGFVLFPIE